MAAFTKIHRIMLFLANFYVSICIANDDCISIEKNYDILGKNIVNINNSLKGKVEKAFFPSHDPETYDEIFYFHITERDKIRVEVNDDGIIVSELFYGERFCLENGVRIGDRYCRIFKEPQKKQPYYLIDDTGLYLYVKDKIKGLIYKFDSNGVPNTDIEKYLKGFPIDINNICETKLQSIEKYLRE